MKPNKVIQKFVVTVVTHDGAEALTLDVVRSEVVRKLQDELGLDSVSTSRANEWRVRPHELRGSMNVMPLGDL